MLDRFWSTFVESYVEDSAYWFQPKGFNVEPQKLRTLLLIFRDFSGTKPWRDCQNEYVARMRTEGLSKGQTAAYARVIKQVVAILGLAWVDSNDLIELSPNGQTYLMTQDKVGLLSRQVLRYPLCSPIIDQKKHQSIALHPVFFLVKLLRLCGSFLTQEEYCLFVARTKKYEEVENTWSLISRFRAATPDLRGEIVRACDVQRLGKIRKGASSILTTISQGQSFAQSMWCASGLIGRSKHGLRLLEEACSRHQGDIDAYEQRGEFIQFSSVKEYFSWMGGSSDLPLADSAVGVYLEQGNLSLALSAMRRTGAVKADIERIEQSLASFNTADRYIHSDWVGFCNQMGRNLRLVGRRFETPVGTIDYLAEDKTSRRRVLLEIWRTSTEDFSQRRIEKLAKWLEQRDPKAGSVETILINPASGRVKEVV